MVFVLCVLAFGLLDTWFLSKRCAISPQVSIGGMAFGILLQLVTVASLVFALLPRLVAPSTDSRVAMFSGFVALLIVGLLGVMAFQQAVLFSDTLWVRGSGSLGEQCFVPDAPNPAFNRSSVRSRGTSPG